MSELNKRVSVIIPTYKREVKYLSRAINSIKNQTYKNIEIIIVDDNPTVSEYRSQVMQFMQNYNQDPDVHYYTNNKNMGGAIARNKGIMSSSGDYITFLDDDDEYLPKKVEKQLEFMIKQNCDMSFTDLRIVNENKKLIDYREYRKLKRFDKASLLKYHIMRHLTGTPTFMYKTEKLKEIGGFDNSSMAQEFYLMLKSIEMDLKICYLNDCDTIAYRHNDGGISQGRNKIDGEKNLFTFKKKYFHIFTIKERMYIRFRHHAVMAIAYKRNKNYLVAFLNSIKMFLASPIDFCGEVVNFLIKILNKRRMEN